MLTCRRCKSKALVQLGHLEGVDHPVYRCRTCGFLFSPPEVEGLPPGVAPAVTPQNPEEAQRRLERIAATRRRPSAGK